MAQNGSDALMNFIVVHGGQRRYRLRRVLLRAVRASRWRRCSTGWVLHAADQYNVAVALQTQINNDKSSPNYLLQNLNQVYPTTTRGPTRCHPTSI